MTTKKVRFLCPQCKVPLSSAFQTQQEGKGRCPMCDSLIRIPAKSNTESNMTLSLKEAVL